MAPLSTNSFLVWKWGLWKVVKIRRDHESNGGQSLSDEEELSELVS